MKALLAVSLLVAIAAGPAKAGHYVHAAYASGAARFQPAAQGRSTVVLSDLHMGIGRSATGEWHPYEDFRWSPEFGAFLEAVDREGRSAVDLVLNGDTFELLQAMDSGCGSAPSDPGCTEPEALARLEHVLSAHRTDLAALARFARAGSNRIVFVPGDHDAALLFPRLGRRVLEALGAPAGRAEVATSGHWKSTDGRVHAEHGHQIGFSAHRFETWPSPFVRRSDGEHLVRPWGETLMQHLYNRYEERYPTIDNLAVAGTGVKYALAADGVVDAGDVAPALLRYLLFLMSWQQFRMELDDGEVEPVVWDIRQVRAQGAAFFVSSLPDDDPFKPAALKAVADGRLAALIQEFSDEQVGAVCDYRAAVRRSRRRLEQAPTQFAPRGPVVAECPRTPETRGARFDYFWTSRDLMFGRYLTGVERQAAAGSRPIAVFVHGHTHLPDRSQTGANLISGNLLKIPMEGFSPVRGELTPVVINSGAWQRTLTPVQYERLRAERAVSDDALLRSLQPEQLSPCYSFVRIPPYTDSPAPSVRYWRHSGTDWEFAATCGR